MKRGGLGKGLDSIIPNKGTVGGIQNTNTDVKKNAAGIKNVSRETLVNLSDIETNKSQPRRKFDDETLEELADSIAQVGVIQPLILQKKDDHFEIIAGERRFRAARLAGLKQIPAIIREYTEQEMLEIALIENIQREDLNPIEEAQAFQRLLKEYKLKQEEVAERVGKSRTAITNSLRLLKLSKRIQDMLLEEMITSGHARALLAVDHEELQYELAMKVFDENLSVRELERLIRNIQKKPSEKPKENTFKNEIIYIDLEEKMKQLLGTKVSIKRKNDTQGKIEIEYYSDEELERIFNFLKK